MTKTIRMLLVFLLTAGLLLAGATALAETGKVTYTVKADEENGFTNLKGIGIELYRVADFTGEGTAWKAVSGISAKFGDAPKDDTWTEDQVSDMVKAIEADLEKDGAPKATTKETDANGTIEFTGLEPGIYYIRKNADSRPKLLTVTPTLVAVPSLNAESPYDVKVTAKSEYENPGVTTYTATKIWDDADNFDGLRPDPFQVTVHLHRTLGDATEYDAAFETSDDAAAVVLNAANSWTKTWTKLEARDENGVAYHYSVTEDAVASYEAPVYEVNEANTAVEITNAHIPEYGAIRVTKSVQLDGQATTGKLSDGTYNFTITGPSDIAEPKKKTDANYLDNVAFTITVTDGKSSTWTRDKLMPGTYVIKEITTGLPAGMTVVGGESKSVEVKAGTTAANPTDVGFVNNRVTGSLKITKTVTLNNAGTGRTVADGTYRFTVTGPSYPGGETVSIKITNGKSNSVQLDNLLLGEYKVEEVKTGLPTGVSYVSGDATKTLVAANTATNPLTFTFVNNRTVTTPPSEARIVPTPTPYVVPTPTPEVTPTPTPTPSPTPAVNISGAKVWRDQSNAHNTRPSSIQVQLLRDGEQIREITVNGSGNRWGYSFGVLPKVDENGAEYHYSVRETAVEGYTTSISGTVIVNELVNQTPRNYTNYTGQKIWKDEEGNTIKRPNYITVRLLRDGKSVDYRTVTAANGWQFSFQDVPVDDGYGNAYTYTVREDSVQYYVSRIDPENDFIVINSLLPVREEYTELGRYGTPLAGFGEPELEGLLELYDYGTPLWGRPLKTGDDMPVYPIVFGGIGGAALIALAVLMIVNKKRNNSAA